AVAFSGSTTKRVMKGVTSEKNEICRSWLCPLWHRIFGNNGICHIRPLECTDAGDLRFTRDHFLAGSGIVFVEPAVIRQVWRLGTADAQAPLRPRLERSDGGRARTLPQCAGRKGLKHRAYPCYKAFLFLLMRGSASRMTLDFCHVERCPRYLS